MEGKTKKKLMQKFKPEYTKRQPEIREVKTDESGGDFSEGMILPDLLTQLKNILHQYPDDGQILKELIQNADDAGASEVKFMLDSTHYPTTRIFSPDMEEYQGPALLAYNNATFEDEDWRGIRLINESVKKTDALKVGRFGLGFKSVFHMTDVPSIVSGSGVGYLDPHQKLFRINRTRGKPTSTYKWELKKHREAMEAIPDQWAPYKHDLFHLNEDTFKTGHYDGTLFRFPLRPRENDSDLCHTEYTQEKVLNIFRSLCSDGHLNLLFLRHVESIALYRTGTKTQEVELMYRVQIAPSCLENVRRKRKELLDALTTHTDCTLSYELELDVENNAGQTTSYKYLVCQHFANVPGSQELPRHLPLVGTALPIDEPLDAPVTCAGQIFCFLPLPLQKTSPTGMNVHVNGYFGVEQNRRHIKWPTAENGEVTDDTLLWNLHLLTTLLPSALCTLARFSAERVREHTLSREQFFSLFPDEKSTTEQWKPLVQEFYKQAAGMPLYFTDAADQPITTKNTLFCYHDDKLAGLLCRILTENGINAVRLPRHILDGLVQHSSESIGMVESSREDVYRSLCAVQDKLELSDEDRGQLLDYLAKHNLHGLKLLPVANGEWEAFDKHSDIIIYLATSDFPASLLPNQPNKFVCSQVSAHLQDILATIAAAGEYQLRKFNKEYAIDELVGVFRSFASSEPIISIPRAINKQWLKHVWEFLHRNMPNDLQAFDGLPMIPLPENSLCHLSTKRPVMVARCKDGSRLEKELKEVFSLMKVVVVESIPDYVETHAYAQQCILWPNQLSRTLQKAATFLHSQGSELRSHVDAMSTKCKRILRRKATEMSKPDIESIQSILHDLPLCETIPGSGGKASHFVSAKNVPYAGPTDPIPIPLPDRLIQITTPDQTQFVQLLSIEEKTTAQVLREIMPNLITQEEREKIAEMSLQRLSEFQSQDERFLSTLAQLKFVATRKQGLCAARNLVWPAHSHLKELLSEIDILPVGKFSEKMFLPGLEKLGLRTLPTVDEVHSIVKMVHAKTQKKEGNAVSLAKKLLMYFEENPDVFSQLKETIQELSWVPVEQRVDGYPASLPWAGDARLTVSPRQGVCEEHAALCGSTCVIMRRSRILPSHTPSLQHVVQHLTTCTACYTCAEDDNYRALVLKVYMFLDAQSPQQVCEMLASVKQWIWKGDGFTSPSHIVAQRPAVEVQPYVHTLPAECQKVKNLFVRCGMKEKCSYAEVLTMIKKHHDEHQNVSDEERQRDLEIAVTLLNHLSRESTIPRDILIPIHTKDDCLQLLPLDECVYCDAEWLKKGINLDDILDDDDDDEDDMHINVVHEELLTVTCERLGVASIMSHSLCAEGLDMSFGQSEKLVDRIQSLLKDYRDGLAIIKELIQNADDAGATEVKLVYDERENHDHRACLFDEAMKELQGPALWAYNDAKFTEDDFNNISKLGGKTKEASTSKIGKFGLGFNAVYNLTDVPCFVSGSNLVYFDPHTSYLGAALPNKSNPGIKLDLTKKRVRKQIQGIQCDQFYPFRDVLGCDLTTGNFDGTLFRFPLRTPRQAKTSKIRDIHYSQQEVIELLKLLYDSRHSMLLFTQNVCRVSVYHIAADSEATDMTSLFTINKSLHDCTDFVIPGGPSFPGPAVLETASVARERHLQHQLTAMFVVETKCSASKSKHSFMQHWLPQKKGVKDVSRHIVCSTVDVFPESLSADLVPVAGVALALDPKGKPCMQDKTNIYCFMALPRRSPYPVHVNGYFSIASNRTQLCERDIHDKAYSGAEWNEQLMQGAVCTSYISLLQKLAQHYPSVQEEMFAIWPLATLNEQQKVFDSLERSFFTTVFKRNDLKLFPSSKGWASFSECHFLEERYRNTTVGNAAYKVLQDCFHGAVVDLPPALYRRIEEVYAPSQYPQQTVSEEMFLRDVLLPNIDKIDAATSTAILLDAVLRAKDQKSGPVWQILSQVAWIPTTPKGQQLKRACELIHPEGALRDLYADCDERYPVWTVDSIHSNCADYDLGQAKEVMHKVLQCLVELGMQTDEIPWPELLLRAQTLRDFEANHGMNRAVCLVSLIERLITRGKKPSPQQENELGRIAFLPVAPKPHGYPMEWLGDRYEPWVTPQETYLVSEKWLLGSVKPLVDDQVFSFRTFAALFLGLTNKAVPIELVLQQLSHATNSDLKKMKSEKLRQLSTVAFHSYKHLQDCIKENKTVPELLKWRKKKCLLPGGFSSFVEAQQLAYTLENRCDPYLFQIPDSFKKNFPDLLDFLGVKPCFDVTDFIKVLQAEQEKNQQRRISKEDEKLVLNVAGLLHSLITECKTLPRDEPIYLPNQTGILCDSKTLCYNDCPWLATDDSMQFCHTMIPFPQARSLGVNTKREARVKRNQIGIRFGQKEKLTNRLKRLLTGYPCGIEIMKEMLQNADDAGAERIHFILDPRTHKGKRVFNDGWTALQGPALLVYNDKPFSQKDLDGIQNLGEGSKADDPNKTGKYGVGFNCVYHVTDTPTFMTTVEGQGKLLCALDPHCRYVVDASQECPGQMFEVDRLLDDFPDVFSCYMDDQPGLSTDRGTMFRLPFRKESMEKSSISDNMFDSAKMKKLFVEFAPHLSELLLFINSVHTITLSEVDEHTDKIKRLCEVKATLSPQDTALRSDFHGHVTHMMSRVKDGDIDLCEAEVKEVCYDMKIRMDGEKSCEKWVIAQRFGVEPAYDIPHRVKVAVEQRDIGLCPRGGVAYKKPIFTTQHATDEAKKVARKNKVFCFLPLPVTTDLPVHVNGNFALSYETRHDLIDDNRDKFSDWNDLMYRAIIASAYLSLVEHEMKQIPMSGQQRAIESRMKPYFDLYPSMPQEDEDHNLKQQFPLREEFYKLIFRKHLRLMPMVRKEKCTCIVSWHRVDEENRLVTYFDTLHEQVKMTQSQGTLKKPDHEELRDVLIECGMILIDVPDQLLCNFEKCQVPAQAISPFHVAQFLKQNHCKMPALPCLIQKTPLRNVQNLRILCTYLKSIFDQSLEGVPIVLTRDKLLRTLGQSKVFHSTHYEAVLTITDCVLHEKLLSVLPSTMFNTLTVDDFAWMLGRMFGSKDQTPIFKGENVKVPMESLPKDLPDNWLAKVWAFIEDAIREHYPIVINRNASVIHELLESLSQWALVPCIYQQKEYLVPLGKTNVVLDLQQGDITSMTLRQALAKLPVMVPNYKALYKKMKFKAPLHRVMESHYSALSNTGFQAPSLSDHLVATINDPTSVLWALANVQSDITGADIDFLPGERRLAREYFATHLDALRTVPEYINTLRCLPIYDTVSGKQVCLQNVVSYVVPQGIPTADMDAFHSTSMCYVFLREDDKLKQLYTCIGCRFLQTEEFYCEFVFKQLELMTESGRLEHLEFIRNITCVEEPKVNVKLLLGKLTEIPFIEDKETKELKTASCYYDPHVKVFENLVQAHLLPPVPFRWFKWRDFLVKLGMISKVTEQHIKTFCTTLATLGQGTVTLQLRREIERKALVIVEFLFSDRFVADSMLEIIKDIKFLPSHQISKDQEWLCEQCQLGHGYQLLHSFSGSAFEEHANYVWSCVPLIPQDFHPDPFVPKRIQLDNFWQKWKGRQNHIENILRKLKTLSPLPTQTVAEHLDKLCRSVERKLPECTDTTKREELYTALRDSLKKIFEYLKDKNVEAKHFGTLRIIPVKRNDSYYFVKGSQVVTTGLKESEDIVPYLFTIPKHFGPWDDLFLKIGSVENATPDTYARVLKQIFNDTKGETLHPEEMVAVMECCWRLYQFEAKDGKLDLKEKELYLLGDDEKLHKSNELLWNDKPSIKSRMKNISSVFLVIKSPEKNKSLLESRLVQILPGLHQPKPLSSVVVEKISDCVVSSDPCIDADNLRERLSSPLFHNGLFRLVAHEKAEQGKYDSTDFEPVKKKIQKIQVTTVCGLKTHLVHKEAIVQGSEEEQSVFVKSGDPLEVIFEKASRGTDELEDQIVPYIMAICNVCNHEVELRGIITNQLQNISKYLTRRNIPEVDGEDVSSIPQCGSYVPIKQHCLLVRSVGVLRVDEYVAVLQHDPLDEGQEGEAVYVYGKIIKLLNPDETLLVKRIYHVNVGEVKELLSTLKLYRFQRPHHDEHNDDERPVPMIASKSLSEIKQELSKQLEAAFSLPGDLGPQLAKRLLQEWDPNNFPEYHDKAMQVFEHLKNEIRRLEKSHRKDVGYYGGRGDRGHRTRSHHFSSDHYFDYIQNRNRHHRQQQREFQESVSQQKHASGFYWPHQRREKNPQPGAGRLWVEQAYIDLQAARNDAGHFKEWVFYKCHQAAEKANRGVQLSVDADRSHSKNLQASCWSDAKVQAYAHELQSLVGNVEQVCYPQHASLPQSSISDTASTRALELARDIVKQANQCFSPPVIPDFDANMAATEQPRASGETSTVPRVDQSSPRGKRQMIENPAEGEGGPAKRTRTQQQQPDAFYQPCDTDQQEAGSSKT